MKEQPLQKLLQHIAEDAIPPAEVDLWSGICAKTSEITLSGDSRMKSCLHARQIAALITIIAFLLTPQGQTWAQSALQFFTHSESNTLPAPPTETLVWVNLQTSTPTPGPTETPMAVFSNDCGDYQAPHCSVAQIRGKVTFPVQELGIIPTAMYFVGATGGPDYVYLAYETVELETGPLLVLFEQPWTGSTEQTNWEIGPEAVIETVPIGDVTGEYVRGSFSYTAGEPGMTWKPDFRQETLRWVEQGVFHDLRYIFFDTPLGKDGMAALAASLTSEPVSANLPQMPPTPTPEVFDFSTLYPLTIAQAKAQAGFDIWEPARLPQVLYFEGAAVKPETQVVSMFFGLDQKRWVGNTDGLTISQQPAQPDCELCGFVVGNLVQAEAVYPGKVVGANAVITSLTVGSSPGQYIEGGWVANDDNGMKWENDPNVKILRWQAGANAFELCYWGVDVDQAALLSIAESMTSLEVSATPGALTKFNPYYPLTLAQVTEQAGFDLLEPTILPEFLSFGGGLYEQELGITNLIYPLIEGYYDELADPALDITADHALIIKQQLAPNPETCKLCGFIVKAATINDIDYPGKIIGEQPETVWIGEIEAQFSQGHWESANSEGFWTWDTDTPLCLRWLADGIAYELTYYGSDLTKDDLIAIAESMR